MAKSDEVPWLNADEQATWFSLIGTLMRLPTALDAQLGREAGRKPCRRARSLRDATLV